MTTLHNLPIVETTTSPVAGEEFTVSGMTCAHCVGAVTREVGAIAGVTDVEVDLASGRVVVASDMPVDVEAVRAAVDEAGYELVTS